MGQGLSAKQEEIVFSKQEISTFFFKLCSKQLTEVELYSFKNKFDISDLDKNKIITEDEFAKFLTIPDSAPESLISLLYEFLKVLGCFPYLQDYYGVKGLSTQSALKAVILNSVRYKKILSVNYDILKLIFVSLSLKSAHLSPEKRDQSVTIVGEKLSWIKLEVVVSFDDIDIDSLTVPAEEMLTLITFLLIVSRLSPHESLHNYDEGFKNWSAYEKIAICLLKTMNLNITSSNLDTSMITLIQFKHQVEMSMPHLLKPLQILLDHLLYMKNPIEDKSMKSKSKLITEPFLSELSTFLPHELVYSKLVKLYIGSDAGFSMRSLESKVFKWNSPTILLVSGKRIKQNTANKRYAQFQEEFPNFKDPLLDWQSVNDKITYGVYLNVPWKITNKDSFGDDHSIIFQLSPKQDLFFASKVGKNLAYFNTIGGGIGFGNHQPILKNNIKRYSPGSVSLTIDSSLEFCVFRHLGLGGEYQKGTSCADDEVPVYEDRFTISDLEVWGCGTDKELAEQLKRWEWEEKEAQARQRINTKNLGEDRAFLEMAGLVGQNNSGGSI